MTKLLPLMYFSKVGQKVFAKLDTMLLEDRDITSQMFEPIDDILTEPTEKERDEYIRTLVKVKK